MIDSQISFPHEAASTDLLRRTFKQFFSLTHYDDMVRQTTYKLIRVFLQFEFFKYIGGACLRRGQPVQAHQISPTILQALACEPDIFEYAKAKEQIGNLKRPRDAKPR